MKYTKSVNKKLKILLATVLCGSLALAPVMSNTGANGQTASNVSGSSIKRLDSSDLNTSLKDYLDDTKVYRLSDKIGVNQEISVLVSIDTDTLLDAYNSNSLYADRTIAEFAASSAGRVVNANIYSKINSLKNTLSSATFDYELGEDYNVLLSGFEVTIKAKNFNSLSRLIGDKATLIVGEEYERCDTQVIENIVDVDESTGIFNSKGSNYDGSSTVIAVLDTGLDYTHSAFDPARFEGDEVLTLDKISQKLGDSKAATYSAGLTANDVYVNKKVPFAYDYADKDPDVYPLDSEHGTHVSGVIVGNDDTIRGVAPNAQLVSMKVFSDSSETGAKESWLLAALEDCVLLGVDVINMSLGSSCGFSNAQDSEEGEKVYNKVKEAGISLVTAASNDYSSTLGSEKNGNLSLTSNPDTATVGSPSTYAAALSVASVSGTKSPYLLYGDTVIYFNEASDQGGNSKYFASELLGNETSRTYEYVTIPGVGRSADYTGRDVKGKIALVKRGSTTFEDKVRVASEMGAAGIIIYNNVSGTISMTVGKVNLPACSISQDDGEILAAQSSGTLNFSTAQVAGPFMSDFSSWGPTPDLKIKPEITAHGGNILSAVPGQSYDRLSGTSMASPNQAGVTALIRQYVKETFRNLDTNEVTARVNQIMMSTADIVYNKNGLPYAVRKQGAGLADLSAATSTPAYVTTYDDGGNEMDKAKLELGDDKSKTGVYTMTFAVNNISPSQLTYDVGAIVMTEGVSETLTVRGDKTITEEGYLLGASVNVKSITGGSNSGNSVTVGANSSATVTVEIALTDADKEYLDTSFANGMYIEGFITLSATGSNSINLNVPYLAFYGDWNQAPIFDIDYFETNPDELNNAIDPDEKIMADAFATIPVGGVYNDYISYLGSYYFVQDPTATPIAASRDHISIGNQTGEDAGVNSVSAVWAGMLRGADHVDITVTDSVTGEVIFTRTEYNQRKSYNYGSSILMSSIDVDFSVADYNLKNNTRYDVKLVAYTAYGDGGLDVNKNNTFEFTFTTDFEAPTVTDCEFYTEYDDTAKKNRLYANISIYDNHYSMAAYMGFVTNTKDADSPYYDPDSQYTYNMLGFDKYLTALYSNFNSTYTLTYELTDHMQEIRDSYNGNSFIIQVCDYALNMATYEISIPDTITGINSFLDPSGNEIETLTLSPNEVYALNLSVSSPDNSWVESVTFKNLDATESIVGIVNGKLIARQPGTATIVAISNYDSSVTKTLEVTVLSEGDDGYVRYDKPVTDSFKLSEFYVDKAYYFVSNDQRSLGTTGDTVKFAGSSYALSFYPSESITVHYDLKAYFPDDIEVVFESSNSSIVEVDSNGTITAKAEGNASVSVSVLMDGKSTYYSQTISITVKNPYITNGMYLMQYLGLGGVVDIPTDMGFTEIYSYAFANYQYIPKDENDEISKEDPNYTKMVPIGENTITKVIIPEGVKTIDSYAFAYLLELQEVVLPSTLKKIQSNAFLGCTKLKTINLENVQFINMDAFHNCPIENLDLSSIVAIGNSAFEMDAGCVNLDGESVTSLLTTLTLPATAQSLGSRAFFNNVALTSVKFNASSVKLGTQVFAYCTELTSVAVNTSVIPSSAFEGCTKLNFIELGKDVSVIGAYAFADTALTSFEIQSDNPYFKSSQDRSFILTKDGTTIVTVAQGSRSRTFNPAEKTTITKIGDGAFSGYATLTSVTLPNVTQVGSYAFSDCTAISKFDLGELTEIGDYAFAGCSKLTQLPAISSSLSKIGEFAFADTGLISIEIADNTEIGYGAFAYCDNLETVVIGDNVVIGDFAFNAYVYTTQESEYYTQGYYIAYMGYGSYSSLTKVEIGNNVVIGNYAFYRQLFLNDLTFGNNVTIGDYAFYMNVSLENIDFSGVKSIGAYAFAGTASEAYLCTVQNGQLTALQVIGEMYFAPQFSELDLSTLDEISEGAFMFNYNLQNVVLSENVTSIGAFAFFSCEGLEQILNIDKAAHIGDYAFSFATFTNIDLSSATYIGDGAFYGCTSLAEVTLGDNVYIGDQAFYLNQELESINLEGVVSIGDQAFFGCSALYNANLKSVISIGNYAFDGTNLTSVTFGNKLVSLGDNPFASCAITEFTDSNGNNNFEISDKAFVKDGVLYSVTPNGGYVLVSYPALKEDSDFTVASGTVRIAGGAFFANAYLVSVELPYELLAIGDKAFYMCENLTVVVFKSLYAPILEEEYDESYSDDFRNHPMTGYFQHMDVDIDSYIEQFGEQILEELEYYKGMGLLPYYMWSFDATNYFYGANFINYVGKQTNPLIFVTPSNGEYYDSFVISQYYTKNTAGAVAPYEATLKVIAAINALPDYITLTDENAVVAARAAYNALSSLEQQALVTNYLKLTSAENTIEYLKNADVNEEPPVEPETEKNYLPLVITFAVLTGVFAAAAIAVSVLWILDRKKSKTGSKQENSSKEENSNTESNNKESSNNETKD